ncbi:F-box only protein 43-like [Antedon mediterranea]|uniref:F-box only protein 43-like n=1 Tax=Antedon mediterranea TaxID=105859 RepID=UPI003AF99D14
MAEAFASCTKRSRKQSSVRNMSKRSQTWPLSQTSTPERQNSNILGLTSPFHFKCTKQTHGESPILTSTPWAFRHHSVNSLLQETDSKPWMSDDWLTPIQSKEINIDGLNSEINLKDLAKNLFDEPENNEESSLENYKKEIKSSDDGFDQTQEPPLSLVKRLSSFDQSSLDKFLVDSGYISSSLDSTFLIGKKMGLRHLDVISELLNVEPNIVDQIVSYLSPDDIQSFSCVCSSWKEFSEDSKLIQDIMKQSIISQRNKENYRRNTKLTTSMNIPLKTVQECHSPLKTPSSSRSSSCWSSSKHNMFTKAASELLSDEVLLKCPRCCSPAKLSMNRQRGNCKRRSCMFDFCVSCQINFHTGKCKVSQKRTIKKGGGVGSKNSKNNLRRL